MFKSIKTKFAKMTLVVMALQLAFLGLGTGATGAYAEISSIQLKTNVEEKMFVAGEETGFTVSLSNLGGVDYPAIYSTFQINEAQVSNIESFKYLETGDGLWYDVPMVNDASSVIGYFGNPVTGFPVAVDYQATSQFAISFKTPGIYSAETAAIDVTDSTTKASLPIPSITVGENMSISNNLPSNVSPLTDVAFTATLDNTYGLSHDINARLTIKNTLITDIVKLQESGSDVALVQSGPDVVANIAGSISGGSVYPFNLIINLATEKEYLYTFDVLEDNLAAELLATYSGRLIVDGTGPLVVMASKPVIVNNVKNSIEVAFTGNEALTVKSGTSIEFTQDTTNYTGVAVQTDPNTIVVTIPADTFVDGVVSIDVSATFVDVAQNETAFSGQIAVDTVAPDAVTGLTTFVDAAGHVTVSWKNPTAGTYTTLRVVRVGDFSVTRDPSVTSYTDLTTEQGKTYQYVVVVGDAAGNETNTSQISVTVPTPTVVVAAPVSDTTTYTAPVTYEDTDTNKEEVKAADTDSDENDDQKTEDEDGFPTWGILLLLVLAAVGGYLIWSQGPETNTSPTAERKNKTNTTKKK